MAEVSDKNKFLAKVVFNAFGGIPKVIKYWDDNNQNSIDILSTYKDMDTIMSYATIGLSDNPLFINNKESNVYLELVGAMDKNIDCFANIMATVVFNIINSKFSCYPGAIYNDVVEMYNCSTSMQHIMFVSPFVWQDKLTTQHFGNRSITWLQIIPISEEERQYARDKGVDKLEEMLERNNADIYDINRKSCIT